MQTRSIKTGKPHVSDNYDPEWVSTIFESIGQFATFVFVADMRLPYDPCTPIPWFATLHLTRPKLSRVLIFRYGWEIVHSACANGFLHCGVDGVKLMVAGNNLIRCSSIGIIFEQDEMM